MDAFETQAALIEVFRVISRANKYIDENAPWILAKDEANRPRLATVMYNLLETVRICASLLVPFMPDSCAKVFSQIGAGPEAAAWDKAGVFGVLPENVKVTKGEALFPRIDLNKELAELEALSAESEPAEDKVVLSGGGEEDTVSEISIDDFSRVRMTVCKVLSCEKVKKSDKLLKFSLDDGSGEPRQIFSGIAMFYEPAELIGKTVVACTNLAPRKMMGQESRGMLLSAEQGDSLHLLMLSDDIPAGATLT
jgi:methionyl-tRNA synthetase